MTPPAIDWDIVAAVLGGLVGILVAVWTVDTHFVPRREFELWVRHVAQSLDEIKERIGDG